MHDNPQAPSGQATALPGHRLIELSGRDAAAFAQAQFMNDVAALTPGHWQWSGWLTPKGRVIALMALLRLADERIWLLLPDADAEAFAAALRRFLFRSKTTIVVRDDLRAVGRYGAPQAALGAVLADDEATGLELDYRGEGVERSLRIVAADAAGPEDADFARRWALDDLRHGLPRLGPDQAEQWTPQQLSLERLQAFSVKKGCYPGQEIVARTHFLGKAKRGLMRLRGAGVSAPAEVQAQADTATSVAGQLICAAADEGLAVMPLDAAPVPLLVGGQACEVLPLLAGLAR
ncbi:YgfZ/GcvT domain-containing protein [Lysobacter silvisoli]|uniref:Folate-binding protein n=1 Tax=Lysobacter silvisoli TaxID=2293254 RepID=A0A371K2Z6_9GAMM|nr:folate-binding protein YgfZ [Lysobacter silvisoli]RDZ28301.1 folate-binding protein [Lysobacter silvisoli]